MLMKALFRYILLILTLEPSSEVRSTAKEISLAAISVSCSKGALPFSEKSSKVSVSSGKRLKKDRLVDEKFTCPLIFWFITCLIFWVMVFGKNTGKRNMSNKMLPIVMPVIFSVLNRIFFQCIVIS